LRAQQWSVEQPHFTETVRALRERIGSADQKPPSGSRRL